MPDDRRRVAESSLGLYGVPDNISRAFPSVTQPFFVAQFRNPQSPDNPNVFNLQVPVPPLQGGTASGDSGGPLFAMINGQLTQIGGVFGGSAAVIAYCAGPGGPGDAVVCPDQNNPGVGLTGFVAGSVYGSVSDWTRINLFLQWINENNPLRQVTAAPGNFNWSNPAAWIDAFADPARPSGAVPDNTRASVDINANQAARYYDVTLSNPGTITLDMNPQIDDLSIMGPQSQLVIGGPFTLQVLLDTTLSAGTLTMLPGGILATGTYTQTGGLLQYLLAPGGAGKITVVNTATLGGTLGVTVAPGLYGLSTQYTLLSAGAISGQFAQFISSPPSAFLSLSGPFYDPTSVNVTLTRTPFGAVAGLTANQRAVGNALEAGYSTTRTGPAATLYTNLLMTGTPDALSQPSGEIHGSVQSVIVDDSRDACARRPMRAGPEPSPRSGAAGRRWPMRSPQPTPPWPMRTRSPPFRSRRRRSRRRQGLPTSRSGRRASRLRQDRRRRQCRRREPQSQRRLHRVRPPLRRMARGLGGGLQQFERERERAGEFRQYRHRICRGLCRHELLGVEFPLGRDVCLEHDRHQPHNRLPRLCRAGDHALRHGRSASVRRGRLRPDLRRHRGRAVRGAGLGASRYRKLHRNRWRERACWQRQPERCRLFHTGRKGGDLLPPAERHGAHPARVGRLAACLRRRDADRGAYIPEHRLRVQYLRCSDCARRRASRSRRRSAAHRAGQDRRLLCGPTRQPCPRPFGQGQFHLAVLISTLPPKADNSRPSLSHWRRRPQRTRVAPMQRRARPASSSASIRPNL